MIPYFEDHHFLDNAPDGPLFHAYFGRQGGVSTDIYASLNCGTGSSDDPEKVKKNRALVAKTMGVAPENLLSVYQCHSALCHAVEGPWPGDRPEGDALVTDRPGLALAIMTADCAPVLFYGHNKKGAPVIGAAHAGWGGALKGVLEATVEAMEAELGAVRESIRAGIGPCILQNSYEVGEDFAEGFLREDPANEHFFKAARKAGHLMFDLPGYCAKKLAAAGVRRVSIKGLDTCFNEEDFFSFRRATHRHEPDYGRELSAIVIR